MCVQIERMKASGKPDRETDVDEDTNKITRNVGEVFFRAGKIR